MVFSFFETSRSLGKPVQLFKFTYGNSVVFGYTDSTQQVSFGGVTYEPAAITRPNFTQSGNLDKTTLEVRSQWDLEVAELFRIWPPGDVVNLIIFHGHQESPADFVAVWTGRVLAVTREQGEAVYNCEPAMVSMRRTGLRRHYQFQCPHVLYGTSCKANEVLAATAGTVDSIDDQDVVVTANTFFDSTDNLRWSGGKLTWTGDDGESAALNILRATGALTTKTLTLSGIPQTLFVGAAVNVIKGCAHTREFCRDVHNNIANFGGFPWIPTDNPIKQTNIFY